MALRLRVECGNSRLNTRVPDTAAAGGDTDVSADVGAPAAVHVYVCQHACMCACVPMCACQHACMRAIVRACMLPCVPSSVHICLCTCVHACSRVCTLVNRTRAPSREGGAEGTHLTSGLNATPHDSAAGCSMVATVLLVTDAPGAGTEVDAGAPAVEVGVASSEKTRTKPSMAEAAARPEGEVERETTPEGGNNREQGGGEEGGREIVVEGQGAKRQGYWGARSGRNSRWLLGTSRWRSKQEAINNTVALKIPAVILQ